MAFRFLDDVPDERVASKGAVGVRPPPFRFAANPYLLHVHIVCWLKAVTHLFLNDITEMDLAPFWAFMVLRRCYGEKQAKHGDTGRWAA